MAKLEEVLGKKLNSVKELRAEIKRLQDSLVGVDAESEQFKTTQQQLTVAQEEYVKVTRTATADNLAAKDSIVGMQREYKNLYDQYKLLSEEQRNSDFGKGMAESLNTLSEKLNSTKKDVGNFKDNIGRYAGDVTQVFSTMGISLGKLQTPLKLVTGGVRTLSAALKSLAANPVGAAIMVIVVAFQAMQKVAERVKKAIRENEESQMRLKESMAVFQPVLNAVTNLWDKLGQVVVKVIGWFTKAYEKIADLSTKFTDFIGVTKGANERMMESIKLSKELAKAENELIKTKRAYKVENAKDTAEVERLREEASETDNLVEKKKMLEEAKRIQGEIDARNVEIAKEEYRIMEEQSKLTPNSTAENEKLADALAKVAQAEADAAKNARQFNREINRVSKSTSSAGVSTVDYRKKAKELLDTLIEGNKSEIQKLEEKYKEEKRLLERYHLDTTLLTKKYNEDLEKLRVAAAKKALDKQRTLFEEELSNLKRYEDVFREMSSELEIAEYDIEKLENETGPRIKKIERVFNSIVEDAAPALRTALLKMWEGGIIDDATNYEHIIDLLNEAIKKTAGDTTDLQAALKAVTDLGEGGWMELTKDIETAAVEVEQLDGIAIKTSTDFVNALDIVRKKLQETYGKKSLEKIKQAFTDIEKASLTLNLDALLNGVSESKFNEIYNQNLADNLVSQKKVLEEELTSFSGTQAQKLEILQQYYDVVEQMRENDWELQQLDAERTQALTEAGFDAYDKINASLGRVLGSYSALVQAQLNDGKITEKEAKKKIKTLKNLEKIQLAVNIAGIAASTASGIMDVWKGYAAELPLNAETAALAGPGAAAVKAGLDAKSLTTAILRTTGLAATGAANIAAATMGTISTIKGLNAQMADLGSSSAGVAAPTPQLIDSTPYTYARTLQTQEEEDEMNRPIYVTVTDIEDGLKNKVTVTNESSF